MEARVLRMNEDPIINCYNYYASLMSMISHDENIWPWFHSRFVQMVCLPDISWYFFENAYDQQIYEECRWLENYSIPHKLLVSTWESPFAFVKEAIDSDYYCMLNADKYYFPAAHREYRKHHLIHEVFVYGYDLDKNMVFIADNFNGKYERVSCTVDELNAAVYHVRDQRISHCMYKKIEAACDGFNLGYVIDSLEAVLHSKPSLEKPVFYEVGKYGLAVYDALIDALKGVALERGTIDLRPFHLMYEHKKCMVARLNYMNAHSFLTKGESIVEKYKELETKALLLRNLAIKYSVTGNDALLHKLADGAANLKNNEKLLVERLLEHIVHTGDKGGFV